MNSWYSNNTTGLYPRDDEQLFQLNQKTVSEARFLKGGNLISTFSYSRKAKIWQTPESL